MVRRSRSTSSDRARNATRRNSPESGPSGSRPEEHTYVRIDDATIIEGFRRLNDFSSQMHHVFRTTRPIEDEHSLDVINARNGLLAQLQNRLLPALNEDVRNLLGSSAAEGGFIPQHQLRTIQRIISRLDVTMSQIHNSVIGIWPSRQVPIADDQDTHYGLVKTYRCRALVKKVVVDLSNCFVQLMAGYEDYLTKLSRSRTGNVPAPEGIRLVNSAHEYIVSRTSKASKIITGKLIPYITRSDQDILQDGWKLRADIINNLLLTAFEKMNVRMAMEEQRQAIIRELRADRRSRERPEASYTPYRYEADGPEAVISDGESVPSDIDLGDREPRYNPLATPDLKVMDSIVTLGKLLRILLVRLTSMRGNAPFRLGEMSSAEIISLRRVCEQIYFEIHDSLDQVCRMRPITDLTIATLAKDLRDSSRRLVTYINPLIAMLEVHLVHHSAFDPPPSIAESNFSGWRASMHSAISNSIDVINQVENAF
ncbi:hypothetical protein MJO28_013345 [Puccinia striiformis f. sp. tritici]|uniref:Uncharacterized protein n=2 Tax=Puccinia striiformis f. sp. tritici TaxID=168172 RepID=A0A0L0VXM3_9BASI|nr:hypothetical protein MJO28_013345 [Puccinia striiformis f. sp. tritici]KAI9614474.1 hypothetical protein KEM48_006049 [Puccinia striiformis f. sp. tritici PST-130]KNF04003.1 hypothetical protein PSTG_02712 [Puccinia striiformis f. sp. tritici PST-78]